MEMLKEIEVELDNLKEADEKLKKAQKNKEEVVKKIEESTKRIKNINNEAGMIMLKTLSKSFGDEIEIQWRRIGDEKWKRNTL